MRTFGQIAQLTFQKPVTEQFPLRIAGKELSLDDLLHLPWRVQLPKNRNEPRLIFCQTPETLLIRLIHRGILAFRVRPRSNERFEPRFPNYSGLRKSDSIRNQCPPPRGLSSPINRLWGRRLVPPVRLRNELVPSLTAMTSCATTVSICPLNSTDFCTSFHSSARPLELSRTSPRVRSQ